MRQPQADPGIRALGESGAVERIRTVSATPIVLTDLRAGVLDDGGHPHPSPTFAAMPSVIPGRDPRFLRRTGPRGALGRPVTGGPAGLRLPARDRDPRRLTRLGSPRRTQRDHRRPGSGPV